MIATAIIHVIVSVLLLILSAIPSFTLPAFLGDIVGEATTIGGSAGPVGAFIPVDAIATIAAAIGAALALAVAIKVARQIISLGTGGGGQA